jgi:hypothetical protein
MTAPAPAPSRYEVPTERDGREDSGGSAKYCTVKTDQDGYDVILRNPDQTPIIKFSQICISFQEILSEENRRISFAISLNVAFCKEYQVRQGTNSVSFFIQLFDGGGSEIWKTTAPAGWFRVCSEKALPYMVNGEAPISGPPVLPRAGPTGKLLMEWYPAGLTCPGATM